MKRPLLVLIALTTTAVADNPKIIKAARLFDGRAEKLATNTAVLVEDGKIKAVGAASELAKRSPSAQMIDLGDVTLLPGLIDVHTHLMMNGDESHVGGCTPVSHRVKSLT